MKNSGCAVRWREFVNIPARHEINIDQTDRLAEAQIPFQGPRLLRALPADPLRYSLLAIR
jgi:hypothetical protein